MNKYEIIVYWSEEYQAFIAEAPELPGRVHPAGSPGERGIVMTEWIP